MGKLDPKGLEDAIVWFDAEFNGLPDSASLVSGVIEAYLRAITPVGEPVAYFDGDRGFTIPVPKEGRPAILEMFKNLPKPPVGSRVLPLYASPLSALEPIPPSPVRVSEEMVRRAATSLFNCVGDPLVYKNIRTALEAALLPAGETEGETR